MTFLATRRRFGRYVYAYGGNPDAAELGGINTRWTIMKMYMLMGLLCAIAAAVASARLNAAVTTSASQSNELYVIAAAVVGGTSFAGGIGTIPGAVLGAFVMQSLALGHGPSGRQLADPERRRRHRPGRSPSASTPTSAGAVDGRRRSRCSTPPSRSEPPTGPHPWRPSRQPARRSSRCGTSTSSFGGVHAVDDVTIDLYAGEVIGLVGGNGAGKSTLMRALSGAHPADSGEILIDGEPVTIRNPRDAKAYSIETIYQTLALADNIDAAGERLPRPRADDPRRGRSTTGPWRRRRARSWAA